MKGKLYLLIPEVTVGATLTAPAVTRTGYTFAGWSPEVPEHVPTVHTTYMAQWTPIDYTITFDANGGIGGIAATQTVYNTSISAPTVTREGYTFQRLVSIGTTLNAGSKRCLHRDLDAKPLCCMEHARGH